MKEKLLIERQRRYMMTVAKTSGRASRRERRRFNTIRRDMQSVADERLREQLQDPMFERAFIECVREGLQVRPQKLTMWWTVTHLKRSFCNVVPNKPSYTKLP
eukprot:4590821-Karenia_brevis.AAC.1